ncbi:hypothetical protein PTSG_00301 [Salpingoeca rosetta]|uniref:Prenyltransferase alpha-alpha toroid domain-containing protein n=1 Tax=Salpingoeca rosetta (strain ATCC 50818 / BSB-021) TaxID=946362 RepID=F2TW34_SALR5|nr:uncharacterized protein PTSG_00301 [Salpingoeca rosetta]EGD72280.1 hypothetical protein PTSG_00301 [Salpingoeca rosetta]|eukprot:XP_004998850.1 hypothetical protein PTSG_00301 [Salpingoeca rosetta]
MSGGGEQKAEMQGEFGWQRHATSFLMFFKALPSAFLHLDTQRLMLTHFAVSGLDILDRLGDIEAKKQGIIDWIYSLQVLPSDEYSRGYCGFRGSPSNGRVLGPNGAPPANDEDCAHLTMTFCALCSLSILGDSLDRVERAAIVSSLKHYQKEDGSFTALHTGGENDMRFVYCACAICTLLDDWSGVNTAAIKQYIFNSQTYEGGFAQGPGLEAHGGSTYCAVASLSMLQ